MICTESVLEWFRGLKASIRIETMCLLLDCSLPLELKFMQTVIEGLGKKDFHELRQAQSIANSMISLHESDLNEFLKKLSEPPVAPGHPKYPYSIYLPNPTNPHNQNQHNNVGCDTRPSPTHNLDKKSRSVQSNIICESIDAAKNIPPPASSNEEFKNSSNSKSLVNSSSSFNNSTYDHEDEVNDTYKQSVIQIESSLLSDERRRRKLILYLSLLESGNFNCAKQYYQVIADVQDKSGNQRNIEKLDDNTIEELAILFSIGKNHPAFSFSQRSYFANVLSVLRDRDKDFDLKFHEQRIHATNANFEQGKMIPPMYPQPPVQLAAAPHLQSQTQSSVCISTEPLNSYGNFYPPMIYPYPPNPAVATHAALSTQPAQHNLTPAFIPTLPAHATGNPPSIIDKVSMIVSDNVVNLHQPRSGGKMSIPYHYESNDRSAVELSSLNNSTSHSILGTGPHPRRPQPGTEAAFTNNPRKRNNAIT